LEASDSFYADVKAELLMPRLVCKAPHPSPSAQQAGRPGGRGVPVQQQPTELQLQASRVTMANYRR
jgi:hypothetical protein